MMKNLPRTLISNDGLLKNGLPKVWLPRLTTFFPVDHLANLLANQNDKIYKYSFDVRNPMDSWPKWSGVKHGAELDYLFGRPILSDNKLFTSEHKDISNFMIEAWTNFVKYG